MNHPQEFSFETYVTRYTYLGAHDVGLQTRGDQTIDVLLRRHQHLASLEKGGGTELQNTLIQPPHLPFDTEGKANYHVAALLGAGLLVFEVHARSALLNHQLNEANQEKKN